MNLGILVPLVLAFNQLTPEILAAQIKVSVDVTESTGGLFESQFKGALRSLGDVSIVGSDEARDYSLRVLVLCEPSDQCEQSTHFTAAIVLAEPLDTSLVGVLLRAMDSTISERTIAPLKGMLVTYEQSHMTWVVTWGRNRYERAIRELIANIDHQCFEKEREMARMVREKIDARSAMTKLSDAKWLC